MKTLHLKQIFGIAMFLLMSGCSPLFISAQNTLPLPNCADVSSQPCIEASTVHLNPIEIVKHDLPEDKIAAGVFSSDSRRNICPKIGLALAGGGSKSAPFAMGAIKRFVDENWLKNVDYIPPFREVDMQHFIYMTKPWLL